MTEWTPAMSRELLAAGHVLISGAPGAGKSYLIRHELIPALLLQGDQVIVVDFAGVHVGVTSAVGSPLRVLKYGEETFGVSNPNAASPAPEILKSSSVVTLDCPRLERDTMCDLLLRSLYFELIKQPPMAGTQRYLVVDISHQSSALSTFPTLLEQAVKNGFTLIVTCQSPSSLPAALTKLFHAHVCFYHFFKRCLREMTQFCFVTAAQEGNMPANQFVGLLGALKVGECFLATPGKKIRKLKVDAWGQGK